VSPPVAASAQTDVDVVANSVVPQRILPGEIAERRMIVIAREGTELRWPERVVLRPEGESVGTLRVDRVAEPDSRVRWTVAYPVTAWRAGAHQIGPVELSAVRAGRATLTLLPEVTFEVSTLLDDGGTDGPPAPPPAPGFPGSRIPWKALPLIPAAVALLTGAGWWRVGRAPVLEVVTDPDASGVDPVEEIEAALLAAGVDPDRALIRISGQVRRVRFLRQAGVTTASTTSEVLHLVEARGGEPAAAAVAPLLLAADALRFGRVPARAEDVETWARAFLEAHRDG